MNLLQKKWIRLRNRQIRFVYGKERVLIENYSSAETTIILRKIVKTPSAYSQLHFEGSILKGTSCRMIIADLKRRPLAHISLDSVTRISTEGKHAVIILRIAPKTQVEITSLEMAPADDAPLYKGRLGQSDILLITPSYPTPENKYFAGFVHARVKRYQANGLKVDIACIFDYDCSSYYTFEGVNVYKTNFNEGYDLINSANYKVVLVHFFDERYSQFLDRITARDIQFLFWVHGPETLYWDWPNFTTPYFKPLVKLTEEQNAAFKAKDEIIKRYAQYPNVSWVFVSEWIKKHSEELIGITFQRSHVIPNIIDEHTFIYREKDAELRKKIFFIRRFDNIDKYAIDINVRAILELSKRDFFADLEFNIYGQGDFYDELIRPIADFPNVKLYRHFLTHEQISDMHAENGLALFATRYDAQGVSMCEAAMSGLVIVGSQQDAVKEFIPEKYGTLSPIEDYVSYADIIERLYKDPEMFSQASRGMAAYVQDKCSEEKTVSLEIQMIRNALQAPVEKRKLKKQVDFPILTIMVPAYNMEELLSQCLDSLLNQANAHKLEILVINDGSKDRTSEIAHNYEEMTAMDGRSIVICIDKENGGHGSTINKGMELARGKYFRIVDADDWLESSQLEKLVDILETEESDVVLTDYSEYHLNDPMLQPKFLYEFMNPGIQYDFDILCYPGYGFYHWGPILSTSSFKTEKLRQAGHLIDEKMYYVDMEYDCFPLATIQTAVYYPLDIYRYFIGVEGQSISVEGFKRHYQDHEKMIHRILEFAFGDSRLSKMRKYYLMERIIMPLVNSHYSLLFHSVKSKAAFKSFDSMLAQYPEAYHHSLISSRVRLKLHRKSKGILVGHDSLLIWTFNVAKKILRRG